MDAVDLPDDLLAELDGDPRKLRFLEWLLTPNAHRSPRSKTDLAAEFDLDRRTLNNWQAKPQFQAVWRREAAKVRGGIDRTTDLLDQLYSVGMSDDKDRVAAIREFMRITEQISPKDTPRETNPLAGKSLEELESMYTEQLQIEIARKRAAV